MHQGLNGEGTKIQSRACTDRPASIDGITINSTESVVTRRIDSDSYPAPTTNVRSCTVQL
jgi:hypothetical protein